MYARVVRFRLVGPTHEEYDAQATAIAESFNEWPGLRAKLWLADQQAGRYGGIYLFDRAEDAELLPLDAAVPVGADVADVHRAVDRGVRDPRRAHRHHRRTVRSDQAIGPGGPCLQGVSCTLLARTALGLTM